MNRKVTIAIGICVVSLFIIAAAAVSALYFCDFCGGAFDDQTFDRSTWIAYRGSSEPDSPRGHMFVDLAERLEQQRPRRAEVLHLLGEPDFYLLGSNPLSPPDLNANPLSYNLGMWSGFRIDYDSLEIEFDDEDRVRKVYRLQH